MALRIAAIGYGDIARRRHFPDIASLNGRAELVAIAGRDAERLKDCAERFNIPRWHTDPAAMLREAAIDAVLVLTPPDSHAEYAEMAVRAGKHVMVEKPLVTTIDEAFRLSEAVRSQMSVKPITFFPLPNVGTPEHRLVDRLVHAGAVGEVTGVECHRGHRGPTHANWFYQKHLAGGGVLFDLGIYGLTSVATLFGPAVSMTAACSRHFDERIMDDGTTVRPDVEDSALISLLLEGKIAVTLNANWNGCMSHHHTRMRTVVIGREGVLHFGVADGAVYVYRPDGNYQTLPAGSDAAQFDGYACRKFPPGEPGKPSSPIGEFVARIEAGDTSTRALDIQTHVLEIIASAYAGENSGSSFRLCSGSEARRVTVPQGRFRASRYCPRIVGRKFALEEPCAIAPSSWLGCCCSQQRPWRRSRMPEPLSSPSAPMRRRWSRPRSTRAIPPNIADHIWGSLYEIADDGKLSPYLADSAAEFD